jgi:septal ring factor EnvC (AmiA/AmiB activator)
LERAQADADVARASLVVERERWEGRLDRLSADLAKAEAQAEHAKASAQNLKDMLGAAREALTMAENQVKVQADAVACLEADVAWHRSEMERLRARPWWRRLFGAG